MEKTNYDSWMPKSIVTKFMWGTIILGICFVAFCGNIISTIISGEEVSAWKFVIALILLISCVKIATLYKRFKFMRKMFDLDCDKSLGVEIVNFVANNMILEPNSKILDVGCGSGALTIAVAKRNHRAKVIGIDTWGGPYKNFSKEACEKNAEIENINNVEFIKDNATKLSFPDETFDGLVSNYVYHNILGDKQQYILESLRVIKKGGKFAIHDIFSTFHYGDLEKFEKKLRELGIEHYEFIETTTGKPIDAEMARLTMLKNSKFLVGIK